MAKQKFTAPFVLPVTAFALTIAIGALLLHLDIASNGAPVPFVDALFTATSSVCVTGLDSIGIADAFNRTGHSIMLVLMQLGGIGILTYSTLLFYIFSKRVSLFDKLAVGQALLHDSSFHLGRFLHRIVLLVFVSEALGAAMLFYLQPEGIGLFNAVFLAVSAFCNAGFAPWPDNLAQWRGNWGVSAIVMGLIILGGIGFFVFDEVLRTWKKRLRALAVNRKQKLLRLKPPAHHAPRKSLSHYSRVVLSTTAGLLFFGALAVFVANMNNVLWRDKALSEQILLSLFQSVTSRTAGFSMADMSAFTDFAVLVTIVLMFIGGSPGSCAGGIKTTTFRVLFGFIAAQVRGHRQVVVRGWGVGAVIVNKALLLFAFSVFAVVAGTLLLTLTENGFAPHGKAPFAIADLFFEAVSAFATVGLSVNLTPQLSAPGKIIVCVLMFMGRLGPIWLISMIQQFQNEPSYGYPEQDLPIG